MAERSGRRSVEDRRLRLVLDCDWAHDLPLLGWYADPGGEERGRRMGGDRLPPGRTPSGRDSDVVVDEDHNIVMSGAPAGVAGDTDTGAIAAHDGRTVLAGRCRDSWVFRGGVDDDQLIGRAQLRSQRSETRVEQRGPVARRDHDGQGEFTHRCTALAWSYTACKFATARSGVWPRAATSYVAPAEPVGELVIGQHALDRVCERGAVARGDDHTELTFRTVEQIAEGGRVGGNHGTTDEERLDRNERGAFGETRRGRTHGSRRPHELAYAILGDQSFEHHPLGCDAGRERAQGRFGRAGADQAEAGVGAGVGDGGDRLDEHVEALLLGQAPGKQKLVARRRAPAGLGISEVLDRRHPRQAGEPQPIGQRGRHRDDNVDATANDRAVERTLHGLGPQHRARDRRSLRPLGAFVRAHESIVVNRQDVRGRTRNTEHRRRQLAHDVVVVHDVRLEAVRHRSQLPTRRRIPHVERLGDALVHDLAGEHLDLVTRGLECTGDTCDVHLGTGTRAGRVVVHQEHPHGLDPRARAATADYQGLRRCTRAGTVWASRRRSSMSDQFWM